jgi:hypothetical protein
VVVRVVLLLCESVSVYVKVCSVYAKVRQLCMRIDITILFIPALIGYSEFGK